LISRISEVILLEQWGFEQFSMENFKLSPSPRNLKAKGIKLYHFEEVVFQDETKPGV